MDRRQPFGDRTTSSKRLCMDQGLGSTEQVAVAASFGLWIVIRMPVLSVNVLFRRSISFYHRNPANNTGR